MAEGGGWVTDPYGKLSVDELFDRLEAAVQSEFRTGEGSLVGELSRRAGTGELRKVHNLDDPIEAASRYRAIRHNTQPPPPVQPKFGDY